MVNGSSMLIPRWLVLVLLLAIVAVTGHAQQPLPAPQDDTQQASPDRPDQSGEPEQTEPETEPIPVFRSGINFIRVDAIVTDDDGNHVADLDQSDFEIYEDGVLQTVETFDRVELGAVPDPTARPPTQLSNRNDDEREASRSDVRVFVIFFDDYHVRFENAQRASLQLTEFLQNNLRPSDLVAVMYPLTPVSELRFTRNHRSVITQVEDFFGRKYDYEPRNMFEQEYWNYPVETIELIRNQVSLSALNGLMVRLGGLREGRKSVLLISEGYTNYVPPQLRNKDGDYNPYRFDPTAGESVYEQTHQLFTDSGIMLRLRELFQVANRFNTSIYSLDPRGFAIGEYDLSQPAVSNRTNQRALRTTQNTLHTLSEQTDGRAIVNRNDLVPGLQQMMRDSSAYYLLGYTSSQSPIDGRFHEIEVRVKRDDIQVRSRKGYWAVTERDAERALSTEVVAPPRAVDVALGALAAPRRGHTIRTWVGTSRGENGRTRVTFVWEPVQGPAGAGDPARVLLTAMGDAGGAFYRGRVPESAGNTGRGLANRASDAGASLMMTTFEAEPGGLQLSVAVEGENGEVLDRDRDEIDIPDFTGTDLVLSTPAFVRARNALEWRELVEDWDAIPIVSRDFRRTERLLLRFEAYAPGTTVPAVEAWLLNRGGDQMFPLIVQPSETERRYQVDIRPAGLPPGDYVVELRVTTADDEVTQLVAFRLGS